MGALDADVLTWLWLVAAAGAGVASAAAPRSRPVTSAVAVGALTGWLTGLGGAPVGVQAGATVAVATLLAAIVSRYLALVRRGSGLPPGTGGGRLVGMTGTITHHDGAGTARVDVLGDEWRVAGDTHGLAEGDRVRVTDVEGVALVVTPIAADTDPAMDDPTRPQPQDGVT